MTREEAIEDIKYNIKPIVGGKSLDMAIQSLTAISELSKSLKAVNRYEMDEKVLIGFNMAVAIFNKCFGESCVFKNEQTDGDLISRTDLLNKIWQKEYGKDYDGVNMLDIPHIDIIENMPSAEKTAKWIWKEGRMGIDYCHCSKCGGGQWEMEFPYCPNCGAKMKE